MLHEMTAPCAECPFRNDIHGYLRLERVQEIVASCFHGESFPCHRTTEAWEDDEGFEDMHATEDSQQCAGAEIFLAHQGSSTQMGRIAERFGSVVTLDMKAPVCKSVQEMLTVHNGGVDPTDIEPCSICNEGCDAPAGTMEASGVVDGLEAAEYECLECGQPVCGSCSEERGDDRICYDCGENEDE